MPRKHRACVPSVSAETTGMNSQDSDITKYRFKRLIPVIQHYYWVMKLNLQDVGHFVFEVLSSNQWVEQISPKHAFESDNLSAGSTNGRIDIKSFPQVVNRIGSRLSSDIEEDTHATSLVERFIDVSWLTSAASRPQTRFDQLGSISPRKLT